MRKETKEKSGRTYYLRYYRDWMDFVSCAEQVLRGRNGLDYGGMSCSSLREDREDWYGTGSLEEAVDLAYRGWPEGREMVRDVRRRMLVERLLPRAQRVIRIIDVEGDEPDIDLYLHNDPEHMVTLHETINPQYGKVLRFVFDCTWDCRTSSTNIVRRGVALFVAFETLLMLGYTVEVVIAEAVIDLNNNHYYEQYIPVLHAGDPINFDTLTFMFINPAIQRRLCFAANECESNEIRRRFGFNKSNSYGLCRHPSFLSSKDKLIKWTEGLVKSDDQIIPFALKILRRVGINIADVA